MHPDSASAQHERAFVHGALVENVDAPRLGQLQRLLLYEYVHGSHDVLGVASVATCALLLSGDRHDAECLVADHIFVLVSAPVWRAFDVLAASAVQ